MGRKATVPKPGSAKTCKCSEILSRISQVLASNKALETTLLAIVNLVRHSLNLERCSVLILDREQRILRLMAAAGIPEKFWPEIQVRIGEGISGRVVFERKPVFVEDISQSEFAHAAHHERYTTRSFVSIPIVVRGEVVGVFNANSRSDAEPLRRPDFDLLVSISGLIGLTIEGHRQRKQIEMLEARWAALFEALRGGALVVRKDLAVVAMNENARRWLGLAKEVSVEGRSLLDLWPQLDGSTTLGKLREALLSTTSAIFVESLRFPTSAVLDHEIWIAPLSSVLTECPAMALLNFYDAESSPRLDSFKSRILSLLAHELRTPFTAIQAASSLLLGGATSHDSSSFADMLRLISSNTRRLQTVVNSLLDLQEIEAQSCELTLQQIDVGPLLKEVIDSFSEEAARKKIAIQPQIQNVSARVDPRRLAQMVSALLDNAIKFSPPGAPVEVSCEPTTAHTFRIRIRDHGPGISPEAGREDVTPFFQSEPLGTRSTGGLGVGLYLTRALAQMHGGRLSVASVEDGGTLAELELPIASEQKEMAP